MTSPRSNVTCCSAGTSRARSAGGRPRRIAFLAGPPDSGDGVEASSSRARESLLMIAAALRARQKPIDRQNARLSQTGDLDDDERAPVAARIVGEIDHLALELLVVMQFVQDGGGLR